jgi:endonuclease/exonuclease/phosphatase family metal-dependent hydrolase
MRIATWNIGGCFIYSKDKREFDLEDIDYFISELKKIKPDIVCLQEVHISKKRNQAELIANKLELYFCSTVIAKSHLKDNEDLSLAVLSKYPIITSRFIKLPNPNLTFVWRGKKASSHDKGFLESNVNCNKKKIRIFCGHMVPFHRFGRNFLEKEFKQIREKAQKSILKNNQPVIVCGDMNFDDFDKAVPHLFKKGFKDVYKNIFTTPKKEKFDHIIISEEWKAVKSKVILGKADHYLCYADIELKTR